ncbi:MAG: DUF1311 domain-containing protein [Cellvibrio sp.]|nr:DUF1311 domain-containing protein [Cellvibrio sp.]
MKTVHRFCRPVLACCLLFTLAGIVSANPSFNCKNASTFTEKRICANPTLAEADTKLAKAYNQFIKKLPEAARVTAKQMQQLWVRERDIWCGEQPPKALLDISIDFGYQAYDQSISAIDLYPGPPADKDHCINYYYQNALDALNRGALISRAFLTQSRSRVRVGVINIDAVEITSPQKLQPEDDYAAYLVQDIFIQNDEQRLNLVQAQLVGCETCFDGERFTPLELRFYLTQSGIIYTSTLNYSSSSGGRCGNYLQGGLRFFSVDGSIKNYSTPENDHEEVNLFFVQETCGAFIDHYHDWRVDKDDLVFADSSVASAYPYWTILNNLSRQAVTVAERKVVELPNLDESTTSLWGMPYKSIFATLKPILDKQTTAENTCAAVATAIDDYFNIKSVGVANNISNAQAMFILNKVMDKTYVKSMPPNFEVAAKVFLDYLDKIRAVENWPEKLQSAASRYPEPNDHFFMSPEPDWPADTNPFIQVGFYSDMGCIRDTPSPSFAPSFGVEEWIYRFWARRHKQDQIEAVEAALKAFLKLRQE